jgi:hypothetical protein
MPMPRYNLYTTVIIGIFQRDYIVRDVPWLFVVTYLNALNLHTHEARFIVRVEPCEPQNR